MCIGKAPPPKFDPVQAQQMRELRLDAELSLREMARVLGLSAVELGELERGQRAWAPEVVEHFKAACWVALSDAGVTDTERKARSEQRKRNREILDAAVLGGNR